MYQGFKEVKSSGAVKQSRPDIENIYAAEDPRFVHFSSRRSVVHSASAMVSSTQPLANEAGYKILRRGGNAADAAVAMAAALNVTEPSSTGIGGDLFCLYYDAQTKQVKAMNGSGRAPAALTLEKLRELGVEGPEIPYDNINGATVPGAAAGWFDTIEAFGSGHLSMEELLMPAIELAEKGFPVSEISAYQWMASEDLIKSASPNAAEILSKSNPGRAPRSGELMRNPTLAQTFRTIAKEGKDGFYKGRIAEEIIKLVQERGGVMTLEDLANHTSTPCDPIKVEYASLNVWEHPPNGQGIVALLTLKLLDILQKQGVVRNLSEMEHNSAEYLHVIIECLRIAFADARYHVTDHDHMNPSAVADLLSTSYLTQRAAIFDPSRCRADVTHGSPENASDTVYFSTVDADGNACSFIISNYAGFGTAAVPKGCGFTLQNRGCNFTLKEGHPNCIAPNKRPYHTIIPAMVTRATGAAGGGDDSLWACYGVMGAFMQPQGHVQVLCNMIHHGLTPQSALDAPRVCVGAALPDVDGNIEAKVFIEDGIDEKVMAELKELGHDVEMLNHFKRGMFGRGQIIRSHVDGDVRVLSGGSDPRGDGAALPCTV